MPYLQIQSTQRLGHEHMNSEEHETVTLTISIGAFAISCVFTP